MKISKMKFLYVLTFMTISFSSFAQKSNPNYDEALAKELKGDDYGMKSFFFVILKTGSNTSTDIKMINEKFRGHLDNINRLVKEEKLVVAGPMGKNEKNYCGIFIFQNIESKEELEKILQTDLAIEVKLLDIEIYNWYGSVALPIYLEASDKIWKENP